MSGFGWTGAGPEATFAFGLEAFDLFALGAGASSSPPERFLFVALTAVVLVGARTIFLAFGGGFGFAAVFFLVIPAGLEEEETAGTWFRPLRRSVGAELALVFAIAGNETYKKRREEERSSIDVKKLDDERRLVAGDRSRCCVAM